MNPLVTIVVPSYNHENYIDDCLDSIVAQTYENIELIICDDCSPDSTYEKIKSREDELKRRFKRVEIIENEVNLGVVKNENRMISLAQGEYIKSIASDDMLMPECISVLVKYAETDGASDDVIFSNGYYVKEESTYANVQCRKKIYDKVPLYGKNLAGKICADNYIAAPAAIIRRETFARYGMYDETLVFEDYEYWVRVATQGQIGYVDEPTVYYRFTENSLSRFDGSAQAVERFRKLNEHRMKVYKKYEKYCTEEDKATFCFSMLNIAMEAGDRETVSKAEAEIKEKGYKIDNYTSVKLILFKLGMYRTAKKIFKR